MFQVETQTSSSVGNGRSASSWCIHDNNNNYHVRLVQEDQFRGYVYFWSCFDKKSGIIVQDLDDKLCIFKKIFFPGKCFQKRSKIKKLYANVPVAYFSSKV